MRLAFLLWPMLAIGALLALELHDASRRAWITTLVIAFLGDAVCAAFLLR